MPLSSSQVGGLAPQGHRHQGGRDGRVGLGAGVIRAEVDSGHGGRDRGVHLRRSAVTARAAAIAASRCAAVSKGARAVAMAAVTAASASATL